MDERMNPAFGGMNTRKKNYLTNSSPGLWGCEVV
jgi:hypothetical protein